MTDPFTPPEGFEPDGLFSGRPDRVLSRRTKHRRKHRARRAKVDYVPFDQRSRYERRSLTVAMGNHIRQDRDGQGVFTSHQILPGSRAWRADEHGELSTWADLVFLGQGRQPTTFFNATVLCVASVWADRLEALAEAAVEAQMSAEDQEDALPQAYSRPDPAHSKLHELIFAPPRNLASLGSLTDKGAQAAWLRAHWDQRGTLVTVGESATFESGYRAGQGLTLVTAEPNLTVEALVRAIGVFRARGERPYEEPAADFSRHQPLVDRLLHRLLYRWDCIQARADGRPKPFRPAEATEGVAEAGLLREGG